MDWIIGIMQRIKKLALLFVFLPILTAVVAYVFELSTPSHYIARARIELGNFENTGLTDPRLVQERLLSQGYIEEIYETYDPPMEISQIKQNLKVSLGNTRIVTVELTGSNRKQVKKTLNAVVKGFVSQSNDLYKQKYNLLTSKIKTVQSIETTEELVSQQQLLYELESKLTDLRPTNIIEPVTVVDSGGSPSKRAVLGFLLGIMADACILFFLEVFRKPKH
jgi:teichuronic acid biosynthesis protein TuaF